MTVRASRGPWLWPYKVLIRTRPTVVAVAIKRLFRIRRRVTKAARGSFFVDPLSNLGLTLLEHGRYEPSMESVLEAFLRPGGVFVDVGANEGYFSVLGGQRVGPGGRVLAVEPQRRLRPVLERNFALNGLGNVTLAHSAVSDRAGSASLHISPDTNTGSTGLVAATRYQVPTEAVETTTLAALFERHAIERADLLKVDIEGAEYEALLGSPELFRDGRVRTLALELHPWLLEKRGLSAEPILEMLRGFGYTPDPRFENFVLTAPGT